MRHLNHETRLRRYDQVFDFAEKQRRCLVETYPDQFPMYTVQGKWSPTGETWTNWCEGFLGGQLWRLWQIAQQYCLTTRRTLVRGDGSTAHVGIFDTQTSQFLRQSTQQGWRDDSAWARGLAWALYGFGTVYHFSGDARFLQTAAACAQYYLDHTPQHGVPPNDWNEPVPAWPSMASASMRSGRASSPPI